MTLDLVNFEEKTREAVRSFWGNRAAAIEKQQASGKVDQGERAGVTSGTNMDGFLKLIQDVVLANGLSDADIHIKKGVLTLPGYFRPTKLWDVLVMYRGELVAVVELKSQCGPSFGNNFNNRAEESIGTAHDFWTAYREGAFGDQPRPFTAWLMMIEDTPGSRSPVKAPKTLHFPVFEEFQGASYLERYNILCQKLAQEQLYTVATLIAASRDAAESGDYSELSSMTGIKTFVAQLAGHVSAVAARLS